MKKKPASRRVSSPPAKKKSAAAHHLGGQPENDADARAAGFDSATAATSPTKSKDAKATPPPGRRARP